MKFQLSSFRIPIIKAGIKFVEKYLVDKISLKPLKDFVKRNLDIIEEVTDVLTDKNPNNKEQLGEVWAKYKNGTLNDLKDTTIENIPLLIKNPINAAIVIELLSDLIKEEEEIEALALRTTGVKSPVQ